MQHQIRVLYFEHCLVLLQFGYRSSCMSGSIVYYLPSPLSILKTNISSFSAVVVVWLVERSLPISETRGSNQVTDNIIYYQLCKNTVLKRVKHKNKSSIALTIILANVSILERSFNQDCTRHLDTRADDSIEKLIYLIAE